MVNYKRRLATAMILGAAMALAPWPVLADWLVTAEGGRIETVGPWRVEGAKVLFTSKNGSLGILRKSEVDLDASAVATAQALAPPPAPVAPAPKPLGPPVMVLTDKDIPAYVATPPAAAPAGAAAAAPAPAPGAPAQPPVLVVDSWQQQEGQGGGIEIVGVVRNRGNSFEVGIGLTVSIVDGQGETREAMGFVEQAGLASGATTGFRAAFPESYDVTGEPTFRLTSSGVTVGGLPPAPPPEDADQR